MLALIFLLLSPDALFRDAKKTYNKGDFELANKKFERFLLKYPEDRHTPLALYWAAKLKEKPDRACEHYKKIINSYPNNKSTPFALYHLAQYEYIKENYLAALQMYKKIVADYPEVKCAQSAKENIALISAFHFIQLAAFSDSTYAVQSQKELVEAGSTRDSGSKTYIIKEGGYFKLKVGIFPSYESAKQFMLENNLKGFVTKI